MAEQRRRLRTGKGADPPVDGSAPTKASREAELEAEIARLKQELAKRGLTLAVETPLSAVSDVVTGKGKGRHDFKSRERVASQVMPHGLNCQCIRCRADRSS